MYCVTISLTPSVTLAHTCHSSLNIQHPLSVSHRHIYAHSNVISFGSIIWQRLFWLTYLTLSSCLLLHSSLCEAAASLLQRGKNSPDYLFVSISWHKGGGHGLIRKSSSSWTISAPMFLHLTDASSMHSCACGCDCTWQPTLWWLQITTLHHHHPQRCLFSEATVRCQDS